MFKRKGFTLIELVMIIVILAILAIVAVPRFFNLQARARTAAEAGVVGAVRSGIANFYADACAGGACAYPATLDAVAAATATPCNNTNPCFVNVLEQGGIRQDWTKSTNTTYTGPTGTVYAYNATSGNFQ
jgi:MSHA pilin protein MshA